MKGLALFDLGFRPFFLFAGISAIFLIAAWVMFFQAYVTYVPYYGVYLWHSHELIFGYAIAVIAGFLLTAVRNWTGQETARHGALGMLVLLWLLGRVLPLIHELVPRGIPALIDLLFIPALGIVIAVPLIKSGNHRNLFFIPVFALFTLCNLLIHLSVLGLVEGWAGSAVRCSIALLMLVISIIGGRVIPFFSQAALTHYKVKPQDMVDKLAIATVLLFLVVYSLDEKVLLSGVALFAALVHSVRIKGWYSHGIWGNPLLWILYISYGWMILGFLLFFVDVFLELPGKPGLHAITIGTVGGITLSMMVRVSLGHTGRPLQTQNGVSFAFALLSFSALVRVFLPILMPELYTQAILVSGLSWVAAFLVFVIVYAPILISPRIDGKPG